MGPLFQRGYARTGLRIDHLLPTLALAKRLTAADVDRDVRSWDKTSDRAPAWIELAVPKSKAPRKIGARSKFRLAPSRAR